MRVTVEFYGIPRLRAGRAALELMLESHEEFAPLSDVLEALAKELPDFARHCLAGNRLQAGYIANINGRSFVTDPAARIADADSLLILSADAGG